MKFLKSILLFLLLTACALPAGQITSTSTALQQDIITVAPSLTSHPTNTNTPANTTTATKTTIPTITPSPTNTPTLTPTPEPLETVRFMQYNIEWGAGAYHECRLYFRPSGKNTLDDVIKIVRAAEPDILAANETCYWNITESEIWGNYTSDQIIKDYFAVQAGFNTCFVGKDYFDGILPDAACVKPGYKLLEKESLKYSDGKTEADIFRGIRVKVQTPGSYEIVIYNWHATPQRGEPGKATKIAQAEFIAGLVERDIAAGNRVIVTGDFNQLYETFEPVFQREGISLRPLDYENNEMMWDEFEEEWNKYGYSSPGDQIWISSGLEYGVQEGQFDELKALIPEISTWEPSDHPPIPAIIYVMPLTYQPAIQTPIPTIPPTQTATVHPTHTIAPTPTKVIILNPQPRIFSFEVENSLELDRISEIVRVDLTLSEGVLPISSIGDISVHQVRGTETNEVLSDYVKSSIEQWPSGDVRKVRIVFQDDLGSLETKAYEIRLEQPSQIDIQDLFVEPLNSDGAGDILHINNGSFDFYLGHELEPLDSTYNGQLPKDLYIRVESDAGWMKSIPLSHIYGNIPEFREEFSLEDCEPILVLSTGFPDEVEVDVNRIVTRISLSYEGWAQSWCRSLDQFEDATTTDVFDAKVEITIYRDLARVDADVKVNIYKTFYNHNGFGLGGVQTELDRPLVLFGNEQHTSLQGALWADTVELTDLPEFMQIQDGRYIFMRGGNRDAHAPFTTIAEAEMFFDYYVIQGENGRGVLGYFPDFKDLAYQETRDEGTGEILALNMIGAGPSVPAMVANPILISQTHLGGLGEIWGEIREGTYEYRLVTITELPFGKEYSDLYDALSKSLAAPIHAEFTQP